MIPNFTFLDPTMFSIVSHGSVTFEWSDTAATAATFLSGRYGNAWAWSDNSNFILTFDTGSHTVEIPFHGTTIEPISAETTFHNGTYTFALIPGGTFTHEAAEGISFGTGTHALTAVVTDFGTESMPTDITFFEGAHNEIAIGPTVGEHGTVLTSFGSGSYYNALPDVDPMFHKAVIRFAIIPGDSIGVLEFTTQGNPVAYNADYLEDHYVIEETPNDTIRFDIPWNGTSFDNRYQLLFDAPTFPNPPGAPPGIIIIDNGTGTNVGSIVVDQVSFGAGFYNGTHSHIVIAGSIPRDIVPNFCTFLYGSHTFVINGGSVTGDHGVMAASFGTGTYDEKVKVREITENGAAAVTFYTGAHEIVPPNPYITADSTVITADTGTVTADNCKPFSFDSGNWPSFDQNEVFNFSQL